MANLGTGFFQGFSISSSSSRTPSPSPPAPRPAYRRCWGYRHRPAPGFCPSCLQNLPNTALAAVVIASAIGLFEIADFEHASTASSVGSSGFRWLFLGVAIFGPIPGILFAIIVALLEFVWDGWRPHYAVLGRAEGVKGYHDITRYPDARRIPGLVLFRWDAPLFFANAEQFHNHVLEAVKVTHAGALVCRVC